MRIHATYTEIGLNGSVEVEFATSSREAAKSAATDLAKEVADERRLRLREINVQTSASLIGDQVAYDVTATFQIDNH